MCLCVYVFSVIHNTCELFLNIFWRVLCYNIIAQSKTNEMKKVSNEKRIKAIKLEVADKYDGREGEGESEMRDRLAQIERLNTVIEVYSLYNIPWSL